MITRTCISKEYILTADEEATLTQAANILDELYANSQENGKWEADFQKARDNLVYLLDELETDGDLPYWKDDVSNDLITMQE